MQANEFKILIDAGLVRKKFLCEMNGATRASAFHFLDSYVEGDTQDERIGPLMIEHGALSPELIENIIITGYSDPISSWANVLRASAYAHPTLANLIKNGALGQAALWGMMSKDDKILLDESIMGRMASIITPGTSNAINWGIVDIFEFEAARINATDGHTRRDEFFNEEHLLLRALRTTEHVNAKRKQVEIVISPDDRRPRAEQLSAVWQHYARQSSLFREIECEPSVPESVRANNVSRVNECQSSFIIWGREESRSLSPIHSNRRFIDIYGRYNNAEMDPLMLSLIAHTVGWYITHQHAHLFTEARLVPDRFTGEQNRRKGLDSVPWAALAAYPKMSLLRVLDQDFRISVLGANRMFLTHSNAKEATIWGSIPIIGLATWKNQRQYFSDRPYALMGANFDSGDCYPARKKSWEGEDQSASITGVIEETLRALREAETLEIARARGKLLCLGQNHRWSEGGVQPASEDPSAETFDNSRYGERPTNHRRSLLGVNC